MEPLTLKPREPAMETIENWDDDGDLEGFDDLPVRAASNAPSVTSSSAHPRHRDSSSSRFSSRSDMESNHGDEDWHVLVEDGKFNTQDAIASARAKGIPLPDNVPSSALVGGTIRRLGGKKIKKAMGDDWSEDLEFPGPGGELKLAKADANDFAESLRQISAAFPRSPTETRNIQIFIDKTITPRKLPPSINLASFKDNDDDDDFGGVPTIKVQKSRSPQKSIAIDTTPSKALNTSEENMEDDFEIPNDEQLTLSKRRNHPPRTPNQDDELDIEWAEGSLGTRHGGTRRDGRSARSSSVSALSPSVSSCLTGESEDEGLDGLVLPDGPLKFQEVLKKRQDNTSPDPTNYSGDQHAAKRASAKDDFFSDFEIGDGDVFDTGKLTLNRNIKHKVERQKSPTRRTATTLTFTSKSSQTSTTTTQVTSTRIPRYSNHGIDRPRSTLEPVSESGQLHLRYQRSGSRLGHTSQSSVSSIPTPSTPSTPSAPGTPSRRGLTTMSSREKLRSELRNDPPTTTSAQLLRAKRSMPTMRLQSPTKTTPYQRPPSRTDVGGSRLVIPPRPKTPNAERSESRLEALRRPAVPFLPAGPSGAQSHHISLKSSRHFRRTDSTGSIDAIMPNHRPSSRLGSNRPETPRRREFAPAELAANAKRPITRPTKRRNFGDGSELEIFDDLPTSAAAESRFVKQPIGKGAPRLRNKLGQSFQNPSVSSIATSRTETPMPTTPMSPMKHDSVPRFARDTVASRAAREQRQVSATVNPRDALAPVANNWKPRLAGFGSVSQAFRKKSKLPSKPQLIKPLGTAINEPKSVKGMHWNPLLFRWEGNENALAPFDVPTPTLLTPSSPKPAPALITNVGSLATGVQISGGMIFDPQRMCWLKMAPSQHRDSGTTASLRGGVGSIQLEEEEDVFAGLEDLKEDDQNRRQSRKASGEHHDSTAGGGDDTFNGDDSDEFVVSEEFDVGPEFIRRQRAEEEKWNRKVGKWIRSPEEAEATDYNGRVDWRWAIRGLAMVT